MTCSNTTSIINMNVELIFRFFCFVSLPFHNWSVQSRRFELFVCFKRFFICCLPLCSCFLPWEQTFYRIGQYHNSCCWKIWAVSYQPFSLFFCFLVLRFFHDWIFRMKRLKSINILNIFVWILKKSICISNIQRLIISELLILIFLGIIFWGHCQTSRYCNFDHKTTFCSFCSFPVFYWNNVFDVVFNSLWCWWPFFLALL